MFRKRTLRKYETSDISIVPKEDNFQHAFQRSGKKRVVAFLDLLVCRINVPLALPETSKAVQFSVHGWKSNHGATRSFLCRTWNSDPFICTILECMIVALCTFMILSQLCSDRPTILVFCANAFNCNVHSKQRKRLILKCHSLSQESSPVFLSREKVETHLNELKLHTSKPWQTRNQTHSFIQCSIYTTPKDLRWMIRECWGHQEKYQTLSSSHDWDDNHFRQNQIQKDVTPVVTAASVVGWRLWLFLQWSQDVLRLQWEDMKLFHGFVFRSQILQKLLCAQSHPVAMSLTNEQSQCPELDCCRSDWCSISLFRTKAMLAAHPRVIGSDCSPARTSRRKSGKA